MTTLHEARCRAVREVLTAEWGIGPKDSTVEALLAAVDGATRLEIHHSEEWAALYVNGVLDPESVGDSYVAEECIHAMLGIIDVYDGMFMRGQTQREGVAVTLGDVDAYRTAEQERTAQADALRKQADALRAKADEIEAGGTH